MVNSVVQVFRLIKPIIVSGVFGATAFAQQPRTTVVPQTSKPTFITFDAPGAGTADGQGTYVASINSVGAIAGAYTDANGAGHGFVRAASGGVTTFDAPGAGGYLGTAAYSINGAGAIAGTYTDANGARHGFVRRAVSGAIHSFEAPGAGLGMDQGTLAFGINAKGVIAGTYIDASWYSHDFLRSDNGAIASFDVPGGCEPASASINTAEVVTGSCADVSGVVVSAEHGFVRATDGTITMFDVPGAGTAFAQGTYALSINGAGAIAGYYRDSSNVPHGFVRAANGTITMFDAPGADGTLVWSINAAGVVAGSSYLDGYHGLLRTANGKIITFNAPGAGTGGNLGTMAVSINTSSAVTGSYLDANNVSHGFLWTP